jgi:membrane magnesium transporter 1
MRTVLRSTLLSSRSPQHLSAELKLTSPSRAYSAHEHSTLTDLLASSSSTSHSSPSPVSASLPADIAIETVVSVVLLCIGLVEGAEPLRPIRWREWAAEVDHGSLKAKTENEENKPVNFDWVEKRKGFLDIRGERRRFADWARGKGEKGL